jgi:hypothetical protein
LRAIVVRGLAGKPGDRYPTIDHLLAELGRDRARPWRMTALAATSVAVLLGVGFGADWIVRERALGQIHQAFTDTGKQVERAGGILARSFDDASRMIFVLHAIEVVTSMHRQADFGLTTPEEDAQNSRSVREELMSQDWSGVRDLQGEIPNQLAIGDSEGHLLYSTAAPEANGDLLAIPAVKSAMNAGKGQVAVAARYDAPAFAAAGLFGATPPSGLALLFARPLVRNGELGGVFIRTIDGSDVLKSIRLDDTELGLVGDDGTIVGNVPERLARAAPASGDITEVSSGDDTLMVQARPLADSAGHPIARVVMARRLPGVLSLFPHARAVFALATLAALGLAIGTFARSRAIAGARV